MDDRRQRPFRAAGLAALVLVAAVSAGCRSLLGASTTPARSYVLTPAEAPGDGVAALPSATIGLLPIGIPGYLDRAAIVTRASHDELRLAERDLWAEGVDRGIARVLVQNLTRLRPDRAFEAFPWRRARRLDGSIALTIERFDGPLGGEVELVARWTVTGPDGSTVLAARRASFHEQAAEASYDAQVAAMSRALVQLSQAVAESLPR
jgi:uncharacterized lipoprotein YmbA